MSLCLIEPEMKISADHYPSLPVGSSGILNRLVDKLAIKWAGNGGNSTRKPGHRQSTFFFSSIVVLPHRTFTSTLLLLLSYCTRWWPNDTEHLGRQLKVGGGGDGRGDLGTKGTPLPSWQRAQREDFCVKENARMNSVLRLGMHYTSTQIFSEHWFFYFQ